MHSPTLTATKWWPGGMGKTATHAMVMARLMLPDAATGRVADHGPHAFIVQVWRGAGGVSIWWERVSMASPGPCE